MPPIFVGDTIVTPPSCLGDAGEGSIPPMLPTVRHTSLAVLACLGAGLAVFAALPVASQPPPEQVTSDTSEYCLHLLDRVGDMVRMATAPPPQEVTSLSTEGQRMCDQGQTRAGILRLRRALLLMMHPDSALR